MRRVTRLAALRAATALLPIIVLMLLGTACVPSAREPSSTRPTTDAQTSGRSVPSSPLRLWMPLRGVRVAELQSNFGATRGGRIHAGIDIMAPRGTPVHSATNGEVQFAGATTLGGWTVWVRTTVMDLWYTHLDGIAPDVAKGAPVTSDTLLGWVGNTGNAVGGPPHLHFEVVTRDGPVDPLPLLRDRP